MGNVCSERSRRRQYISVNIKRDTKPPVTKKDDRIAIIGTGPAGLYTAIELHNRGYKNIVLYEKGDGIGGKTHSIIIDNHGFDFSTKFIPAGYMELPTIWKPMQELIDASGEEVRTTGDTAWYNVETKECMKKPHILSNVENTKLVNDFIDGFTLLRQLHDTHGIKGILDANICKPGQTFGEWIKERDMPAFGELGAYMNDVFGSGPAVEKSAAFVLRYRTMYMHGYIKRLMVKVEDKIREAGGICGCCTECLFDTYTPDYMDLLMDNGLNHINVVFKRGYQSFFDGLAKAKNLDIKLNMEVIRLNDEIKSSMVEVETARGKELYDRVIVTTAGKDAMIFLPQNNDVRELYSKVRNYHQIMIVATRCNDWPGETEEGVIILYPAGNHMASSNMNADAVVPMGVSKEYKDCNVLFFQAYVPLGMQKDDAEKRMVAQLPQMGFTIDKVIRSELFQYPEEVPPEAERDGWFDKMHRLQGQNGIYYTGEMFASPGAMSALHYARYFARYFF